MCVREYVLTQTLKERLIYNKLYLFILHTKSGLNFRQSAYECKMHHSQGCQIDLFTLLIDLLLFFYPCMVEKVLFLD